MMLVDPDLAASCGLHTPLRPQVTVAPPVSLPAGSAVVFWPGTQDGFPLDMKGPCA